MEVRRKKGRRSDVSYEARLRTLGMCILEYAAIISIRNESLILQCVPRFIPFSSIHALHLWNTKAIRDIERNKTKIGKYINFFFFFFIIRIRFSNPINFINCLMSVSCQFLYQVNRCVKKPPTYLEILRMRRHM